MDHDIVYLSEVRMIKRRNTINRFKDQNLDYYYYYFVGLIFFRGEGGWELVSDVSMQGGVARF